MGALAAFPHNLMNLVNFRGRSSQRQFWPYALVVGILAFATLFAIMIPEMQASMERMQRFAAEHPELATVERGPGTYSITIEGHHPELFPDISRIIAMIGVVIGSVVLLLAAAVVRRLHDRGVSGALALMPLVFLTIGCVLMPILFNQDPPQLGLFLLLFVNNALYLLSLIGLIIWLSGPSKPGENRYGSPPAA